MSAVLDEHREYLSDEIRLASFRTAIAEVVKAGDVVLDLGSGTGVLGLFACQAGAAKVYAIEQGSILGLARQICQANGFADRVVFIKGLSMRTELPQRVDVVVADQIGFFGFEAGLLEYFSDTRQRFLTPCGRMIPSHIELWAAPIEIPDLYAKVEFWSKHRPATIDLGAVHAAAVNRAYAVQLEAKNLLSEPQKLTTLDLAHARGDPFRLESSYLIARSGRLHGVGGWFSAQLSPNVVMTNSPVARLRMARDNAFLPLERPLDVIENDRVLVTMHVIPAEKLVSWNIEVSRKDKATWQRRALFRQSTFKGMLLGEEDLRYTRSTFVPRLTGWGEARLSVLNLCDGRRALPEIETEVYRRHPRLFRSSAEAASFVAEVVARDSQ